MPPSPKATPARSPIKSRKTAAPSSNKVRAVEDFPIIGIGCSAGGLEALEKFFTAMPVDTGMACIVVQHLAPDHTSALAEILQRFTTMPVREARHRMPVEPDHVYVIPPNKDMALRKARLQLREPLAPRGLRLSIDHFLRSLAEDQTDHAIGILFSGMGSDGTFGLRAIKEQAGLTLVQDPASAHADGMPRSAIEAGVADIVVIPEAMPTRIADYLANRLPPRRASVRIDTQEGDPLQQIVGLLRDRTGNDFSLYKTTTLDRRIERRMALHQIADADSYLNYLRDNPQELGLLFKELLIGVTSFFRDPEAWEALRQEAWPELFAQYPNGKVLRAWVPACSTGEEAYSLAIAFREAVAALQPKARFTLQIYATDLDADAIDRARKAVYPKNIVADLAPELIARHFVDDETGYRVCSDIRGMVVFAQQNVISDPPFTKLDILCCRNLLIYFQPALQKKLFPLFHYGLNRGGFLLLGNAETTGEFGRLFKTVNSKARLYRRLDQALPVGDLDFPAGVVGHPVHEAVPGSPPDENIGALTDQIIQQNFSPAAVLVNAHGDILYISGRTGKYLEPAAGKVNINLYAMAREGLRESLTGMVHKALTEGAPIHLKGLKVGNNGGTLGVDVTVQPLDKPDALRGRALVVFTDVPPPPRVAKRDRTVPSTKYLALEQELQQTRESLQATHEEMQAAMEELKSSNEELQSTNEELQSANEELTTSKEELQSLNEELQTVNAELQSKVEDLTWVRNDMTNLLNSTEIATIFLDNQMKLRRFTNHATKLFRLIHGDVGRPLSHVVSDLDYPTLQEDAQEVLSKLSSIEKQIKTYSDNWYRVRIMPYRTLDNVIDGVVITFIDITETKRLESGGRQSS